MGDVDFLNDGIDFVAEYDAQLAAGLKMLAGSHKSDALYNVLHIRE